MNYNPNELEMTLRIALKGINTLLDTKPKGGLVVRKGTKHEARMSYEEAKLCVERIERMFQGQGAFSMGICGNCTKWNRSGNNSGRFEDFGNCPSKGLTHRYGSCDHHSKENGGWGL